MMRTVHVLAAAVSMLMAFTAQAANYSVFAQSTLDGEYETGIGGGALVVPIGGDGFNRYTTSETLFLEPFDPTLGTLLDVQAIMSVSGDVTLDRLVITEGTVGGTFSVDTRTNITFDFPGYDETPGSLGPPVGPTTPLGRPLDDTDYLRVLDVDASVPFFGFFTDITANPNQSISGTTTSALDIGFEPLDLNEYVDQGDRVFTNPFTGETRLIADTVPITVTLSSTTELGLTCFGLGGCQASSTAEFDTLVSVQLTYIYDEFPDVTVVPLPPAVWLFGSALVGLAGASKRKSLATKR